MGLRLGTSERDVFGAANGNDLVLGFEGNDTLATGAGTDLVVGGIGNDEILIDTGTNILIGGADADTFTFREGASGTSYIADFEDGYDKINLAELGVKSFAELDITMNSQGAVITFEGLEIRIWSDNPQGLGAEDFIFAQNPEAQVLSFEDISHDDGYAGLIDDYAGFQFSNFGVLEFDEYRVEKASGYRPYDGDNLLYNAYGNAAGIEREENFDLESICLSAAWSEGLYVTIEAYDDDVFIGKQVLSLSYGESRLYELDDTFFDSVDYVRFSAEGGVDIPTDTGTGTQFGMDQMTIIG